MGIDALDISFRIEKQFKVPFRRKNDYWPSLVESIPPYEVTNCWSKRIVDVDISAGRLFEYIQQCPHCRHCGYDLQAHEQEGICPQCKKSYAFNERQRAEDWETYRKLLSDALGVKADEITPASLLVKDLGMS